MREEKRNKKLFVRVSRRTGSFSISAEGNQSSFIPENLSLVALPPTDAAFVATKLLLPLCAERVFTARGRLAGRLEVEGGNANVASLKMTPKFLGRV